MHRIREEPKHLAMSDASVRQGSQMPHIGVIIHIEYILVYINASIGNNISSSCCLDIPTPQLASPVQFPRVHTIKKETYVSSFFY